jgi:2-oxoglutarate ferredoxin oxidoreductase subunit beta
MTGGQMGPTTVMGQITSTSPFGRNREYNGYPIKSAEHMALCDGVALSARVGVYDIKNIINAKNIIKKAFQNQIKGLGYSYVEVLSSCPTNWKLTPKDAHKKIEDELTKVFPIKVFKDVENE